MKKKDLELYNLQMVTCTQTNLIKFFSYEGEFKNNKKDGKGCYKYASGNM